MTKTTNISGTAKQHTSLQQIITEYFSDGKRDTCTGVIKHIAEHGYQAKGASAVLYLLYQNGVLRRMGCRGSYRYQLSDAQPKDNNKAQMQLIPQRSPKDSEALTLGLFHKVNQILLTTRRGMHA